MRIAITGATGVLGSALARALCARGDSVVALSRRPDSLGPRLAGLPVTSHPYSPDGLNAALASGPIDALIHAACAYGRQGESAGDLLQINALEPLRLVQVAGTRLGRWISIGTGLPPSVSPYALSKHQFADWLAMIPAPSERVVVELEHFYGPGDEPSKFLSMVARACLANRPLDLTEGTQLRDFIHISDAVSGIMALVDHAKPGFQRIPLGSGNPVTVRNIVEMIHLESRSRSELRFGAVPPRPQEPVCCVADTTAIRSMGWKPIKSLGEGIRDLVVWETKET